MFTHKLATKQRYLKYCCCKTQNGRAIVEFFNPRDWKNKSRCNNGKKKVNNKIQKVNKSLQDLRSTMNFTIHKKYKLFAYNDPNTPEAILNFALKN